MTQQDIVQQLMLNYHATLIVSGQKSPSTLTGMELIQDTKRSIHSYMVATATPVCNKDGKVWYNNWFEIDEFCLTFLDWIRIHECSNPDCEAKAQRNSLVDFLADKCIEQTVMFIDGTINAAEYKVYQMIVNLLHLGTTFVTAKQVAQRECGMIIYSNADHLFQDKN